MPLPSGAMTRPNSDPAPVFLSAVCTATCWPAGVVSTMLPSPPLLVMMLPFGASTMPSGSLRWPPSVRTVPPFAAGVVRVIASEIARILLSSVEATYSVPLEASASPVGPSTRASAELTQGMPLAITVSLSTFGVWCSPDSSSIRSTVELSIVWMPFAAPPLSALLTNSAGLGAFALSGRVPRTLDVLAGDRLDRLAFAVEHDQAAVLRGRRLAVGRRQAAHDDVAARQDVQRRRQPDAAWAWAGERLGVDRRERRDLPGGRDLHDRRAGALTVLLCAFLGVEVADQHLARLELAHAGGNGHDAVGVDIAVGRDRRGDLADARELGQERAGARRRFSRRAGTRRGGGAGELLVLLELPQPATASATPARARIDVLGTGVSPVVRDRTRRFPDRSRPTASLATPGRLSAAIRRTARRRALLYDSALAGFLPGELSDHSAPAWPSRLTFARWEDPGNRCQPRR